MKIKNLLFLTLIIGLLSSCGGEILSGKTRSDRNDEFLVEKKNPLSMPPDFNELPEPSDNESDKSENQNNLKEILNIKTNNTEKENTNKNTSLENKILEKINN